MNTASGYHYRWIQGSRAWSEVSLTTVRFATLKLTFIARFFYSVTSVVLREHTVHGISVIDLPSSFTVRNPSRHPQALTVGSKPMRSGCSMACSRNLKVRRLLASDGTASKPAMMSDTITRCRSDSRGHNFTTAIEICFSSVKAQPPLLAKKQAVISAFAVLVNSHEL